MIVGREKKVTKSRLSSLFETVCADIGFRHESSAFLEEVCDDFMDDYDRHLVGAVNLRQRLEKSGMKLKRM